MLFSTCCPTEKKKKKKQKRDNETRNGNEEQTGNPYEEESGSHGIVPLLVFADIESMQEPNLLIAETDKN